MTAGTLLSQFGHAITECLRPEDLPLPADTRIVVLGATREQLEGVITAIGLFTRDRASLKPILGELRPYRNPAPAPSPGADNASGGGRGERG